MHFRLVYQSESCVYNLRFNSLHNLFLKKINSKCWKYNVDIMFIVRIFFLAKYVIFSKLKRKARNKMQNCPKLSFNFSFIHRIFFLYARIIVILLLVCILYSNCSDYFFSNKFYILKSNCKDLILNPNHPGRGGGGKIIIICWKTAISLEPNISRTINSPSPNENIFCKRIKKIFPTPSNLS